MQQIAIITPEGWNPEQYALLDSGEGYKLERFGSRLLARPEPQAIWRRKLPPGAWEAADAVYSRDSEESGAENAGIPAGKSGSSRWTIARDLPESWQMVWGELRLVARLTAFKHTGIFPEQSAHWVWLQQVIARARGRQVTVLNLFGYTGIASLLAASAGAQVTHLDAAPKVIEWARENQQLSGLGDLPIRWIVDDALKFVRREARRGSQYDLIIMDPPAFGRGPKGEVWKFESSLPQLLTACGDILTERPLGVLINSYSIRASALLLSGLLHDMVAGTRTPGTIVPGELVLHEQGPEGRLLSTAIFARWTAGS